MTRKELECTNEELLNKLGLITDGKKKGGGNMAPTAMTVCDMLDTSRKKDRIKKAQKAMDRIASIIGEDKGWDSEEEMLEDMAKFRSSQIKGVNQNGE